MELPHSYFWNITKSPTMIYNGRLYCLSKTDRENKNNIIKIDNDCYSFEVSESLRDLEALYNTDCSKEIEEYKSLFLNKKLKDTIARHIKWKLKTVSQIKSQLEENDALIVILEKIIPEVEGKNPLKHIEEYASQLPKEEIQKFKEKVSEIEGLILNEKLVKIEARGAIGEEAGAKINNLKDKSNIGRYIFHNFNVVILSPTKMFVFSTKKSSNKIEINGENHYLQEYKEYKSLDAVEGIYIDLLENLFNCEALQNVDKTIEELDEIYKQEALLSTIIKGEEFHGKGGGFYRHRNGKYVFYINFPQFVNKLSDDRYALFPAGKIAVGANYDAKRKDFAIIRDSISVLSRYRHPFTKPLDTGDESHFCIGSYTMKREMPGYEKIPQVLAELKTLLMSGYNVYHRNKSNVYGHFYTHITKAEAEKRKIPITNEGIITSDNIKKKYDKVEDQLDGDDVDYDE